MYILCFDEVNVHFVSRQSFFMREAGAAGLGDNYGWQFCQCLIRLVTNYRRFSNTNDIYKDVNYNATSDKPATSITPPTRWRLPVTRTWTGFGDRVEILSNSLMASSIDGKTWIWEGSKSGRREDHATLRACCILSPARSAVGMAFVVKSNTKWG